MKALSLTPWWAHIVASRVKPIENRRWNTKFRGTFLIHASLGKNKHRDEVVDFLEESYLTHALRDEFPGYDLVERGGIVGVATLIDVVHPGESATENGLDLLHDLGIDPRWHMNDQYGFVLANIERVEFVPCKGALKFWEVSNDILSRISNVVA